MPCEIGAIRARLRWSDFKPLVLGIAFFAVSVKGTSCHWNSRGARFLVSWAVSLTLQGGLQPAETGCTNGRSPRRPPSLAIDVHLVRCRAGPSSRADTAHHPLDVTGGTLPNVFRL